jgi:peptidoglycan-associated lipoprotein
LNYFDLKASGRYQFCGSHERRQHFMRTRTWFSIPALAAAGLCGLWSAGCAHNQTAALPNLTTNHPTAAQQPVAETPTAPADTGQADLDAMLRNDVLHFDYDKANLSADDQHRLQHIADILSKHPALNVRIAGNCDERGTEDFNLQLGQERAAAAQKYLVNLGVDAARIATISYGKDRPVNPAHTSEAWAENRRDDIQPKSQNP